MSNQADINTQLGQGLLYLEQLQGLLRNWWENGTDLTMDDVYNLEQAIGDCMHAARKLNGGEE